MSVQDVKQIRVEHGKTIWEPVTRFLFITLSWQFLRQPKRKSMTEALRCKVIINYFQIFLWCARRWRNAKILPVRYHFPSTYNIFFRVFTCACEGQSSSTGLNNSNFISTILEFSVLLIKTKIKLEKVWLYHQRNVRSTKRKVWQIIR